MTVGTSKGSTISQCGCSTLGAQHKRRRRRRRTVQPKNRWMISVNILGEVLFNTYQHRIKFRALVNKAMNILVNEKSLKITELL